MDRKLVKRKQIDIGHTEWAIVYRHSCDHLSHNLREDIRDRIMVGRRNYIETLVREEMRSENSSFGNWFTIGR